MTALPGATVTAGLRAEVERVAGHASDAGAQVEERLPKVSWDEQKLGDELMTAVTGAFDPGAMLPRRASHLGLVPDRAGPA